MNAKKRRTIEIAILLAVILTYGYFVCKYFAMLPDIFDPIKYIKPAAEGTLTGNFFWLDRLMIADGIRFISFFSHRTEIAGAIYFGAVNFAILLIAIFWAYFKKGFWPAFITGILLITSYPLLRYANYGYPDATVALLGLIGLIFSLNQENKYSYLWTGFFVGLALFSKMTALAFFIFFLADIIISKRYLFLKEYFAGILMATASVLVLTIILFNFESLLYVFNQLGYNLASNTEYRNVTKSIFSIFFPEIILPALFSLVIFRKAYQDETIRKLFLAAWYFIGFFFLLFLLSRHVKVYPHYLYSAFILALIGAGLHLGEKVKSFRNFLFAFFLVILAFLSIYLGVSHPFFNNDLIKGDWSFFKILYFIFPIAMIGLMIFLERLGAKKLVIIFLALTVSAGGFLASSSAYFRVFLQKKEIKETYNLAESLSQTSDEEFLSKISQTNLNREKVLEVYNLFYKEK